LLIILHFIALEYYIKSFLFLSADVKMPSGNIDKPTIEDNRDGTVSIRYDPREEGAHELTLKYNGENVQGSFTRVPASQRFYSKNFLLSQVHPSNFMLIPFHRAMSLPTDLD
jgi:hypothetical protein